MISALVISAKPWALRSALTFANNRNHELATLEHLLLALVEEADAARVLNACDVNIKKLEKVIVEYLDNELDRICREYMFTVRGQIGVRGFPLQVTFLLVA